MKSLLQRNISARSFWILLGLLQLAYFIVAVIFANFRMADSIEYLQEAQNIKDQFLFYCGDPNETIEADLLTKRTPLYPLFLSGLTLLFKNPNIAIAFLQSILSFLNIFLLISILRTLKINIHYLLLFLLIVFTPAQMIYSNMVMSEILFQSTILACFFYFVKYHINKQHKYLLFYIICIVLAALIKPVFYLFAFANMLFGLFYWQQNKDRKPLLYSLIPVVFVFLYCGINQYRTGHFHYSSIQKINALNYNSYYFLMQQEGSKLAEAKVDAIHAAAEKIDNYKEQSQYIGKETRNILMDNLVPYTIYHLKGISQFFLDPGRFDLANFFGTDKDPKQGMLQVKNESGWKGILQKVKAQPLGLLVALGFVFLANLVKLLGLIQFLRYKKVDLIIKVLSLGIIAYLAFLTGPLGASRFALPVFMLVLFCVMIGLGQKLLTVQRPEALHSNSSP